MKNEEDIDQEDKGVPSLSEKVCEKCGGELFDKRIGDESYKYCSVCNRVTHQQK